MKVLITGSNGFLGKACFKLLNSNNYLVLTTDKHGNVDFRGDLSNLAFTNSLPDDIDVIVNCSAVQYVSNDLPFFRRHAYFEKNNVLATKNLIEKYLHSRIHFIHIGTSMMYQQSDLKEYSINSPMKGNGVYSSSKCRSQVYVNQLEGSATIIPCIIGGAGRGGLFNNFISMIIKWGFVVMPGNGNHLLHMVHVDDVADLVQRVISKRATGFFNAAAPKPLSILQWIEIIQNELKICRVKIISIPLTLIYLISVITKFRIFAKEQLLMLKRSHVLSVKESLDLGWKPKFSNEQIIRDITNYISANLKK